MQTLIVCKSAAHGNTRRVAEALGRVLEAEIVEPAAVDPAGLAGFDLVGFGSGIYNRRFHRELRTLIAKLPRVARANAFVFATSGFPDRGLTRFLQPIGPRLTAKGYEVIGNFSCRGLDTWGPFGLVGGMSRHHPDADDLAAARDFATRMSETR